MSGNSELVRRRCRDCIGRRHVSIHDNGKGLPSAGAPRPRGAPGQFGNDDEHRTAVALLSGAFCALACCATRCGFLCSARCAAAAGGGLPAGGAQGEGGRAPCRTWTAPTRCRCGSSRSTDRCRVAAVPATKTPAARRMSRRPTASWKVSAEFEPFPLSVAGVPREIDGGHRTCVNFGIAP